MRNFVYNNHVRNVNKALANGLRYVHNRGTAQPSRVGSVMVAPSPVITIYDNPRERVLFSPMRDANPFFHLFESLWMLAGRNDLPWLTQFNKRFNSYSDDGGKTQPAAYGHRWRGYFGHDQLESVIGELRANPGSRRAVLAMWDGSAAGDLERVNLGSADIPCNTHCYFRVEDGRLDMTVMCRSNDLLWGAHGANAVHFSVLQEFIATALGLEVGTLYQFSNNYHYYTDIIADPQAMSDDAVAYDLYSTEQVEPSPLFTDLDVFMNELPAFMDWAAPGDIAPNAPEFSEELLGKVAVPMRRAWALHKRKDYGGAEAACGLIAHDDWRIASRQWMERRAKNHRAKANG